MESKQCISCNELKLLNEFAFSKGKPREKCKVCLKEYMNNHYASNKKTYLDNVKTRQKEIYNWFYDYKQTLKCEKCGENHPGCLDFHHLDPNNKDFNISDGGKMSKKRILNEVNKCIVLCSNCHRKLHWGERNTLK